MLRIPGSTDQTVVTWALLTINIAVWLAMGVAGGSEDSQVLLDFGAMFGPRIANGEYWRLFTAMFLHVGIVHLLFNGFGLFIFGRLVEGIYGHTRFIIIYILAGLLGSVSSYLFNSIAIGAGASGAIFGVLGALTAYFVARRNVLGDMGRQNLTGLLFLAGINLIFGFTTSGIDNWAHMGGMLGGFVLGYIFAPRFEYRSAFGPVGMDYRRMDANPLSRTWWVIPIAAAILGLLAWVGTTTLPDNPETHLIRAEQLINDGRYEEALAELDRASSSTFETGDLAYIRQINLLRDRIRREQQFP